MSSLGILIDTNVMSQASKPKPSEAAVHWLSTNDAAAMYLSVVTLTELRVGIGTMSPGRRRTQIQEWMEMALLPHFSGRILPVDEEVACDCGDILARAKQEGHSPDLGDALLAATARVHKLTLVTLNRRHFERLYVPIANL